MSERGETQYSFTNYAECQVQVWTESKSYSYLDLLSPLSKLSHSVQKEVWPMEKDLKLGC